MPRNSPWAPEGAPPGRPRLTEEDLAARIAAYCRRYGVEPRGLELPPFPSGKRETPQHREWMGLYKLSRRLGRRARGQCERCSSPASPGSVFCEEHRHPAAVRKGEGHATAELERRELHAAQAGRCPICAADVGVEEAVEHATGGRRRWLLHPSCRRLVAQAEAAGPEAVDRLRAHLWPRPPRARS